MVSQLCNSISPLFNQSKVKVWCLRKSYATYALAFWMTAFHRTSSDWSACLYLTHLNNIEDFFRLRLFTSCHYCSGTGPSCLIFILERNCHCIYLIIKCSYLKNLNIIIFVLRTRHLSAASELTDILVWITQCFLLSIIKGVFILLVFFYYWSKTLRVKNVAYN